jgi:hypothetical protein
VGFSNACHNIGANDNDTCMHLFVNSLEGKAVIDFFELPPKILSTWEELIYWFRSTYGQSKSPAKKLREYNNVTYKDGETIRSFNLHFTKLYNQIPELIHPQNQATFMHYYNAFLLLTVTGLKKRPLIISVPLCTLDQSMRSNLNELVYPNGNQLDR